MAVQSLSKTHSTPSLDINGNTIRGRPTNMDSEKVDPESRSSDVRVHTTTFPSQKMVMPRWRTMGKGKEKSTLALVCVWLVEHQIGIAVHLLSLLFFTHLCFPRARHHTQKFFSISYYNSETNRFALGWNDIFFVFFWIIVFTGLRCVTMDYLLIPLAEKAGLRKKKIQTRFAEQAWILLYPGASWLCGMYIFYNSSYWLDLAQLWVNYPTREMPGLTKWYYLVQFAYWLQQIVVVNIEERRKDHWQMFTHHIITCVLIFTSYGYHQSAVGNVILCLMDVADLFLPLAKVLKYLKYKTICDITFGVFMITWFVTRHIFYVVVCWSIFVDLPRGTTYGCYRGSDKNLSGPYPVPNDWDHLIQPFYDPEGFVCMNDNIRLCFLGLLIALQGLLLIWFYIILKVAYRVIRGQGANDARSEDEDTDEDSEETKTPELEKVPEPTLQPAFIEQEVGVEDLAKPSSKTARSPGAGNAGGSGRRSKKNETGNAATTGVSLIPGDRKELLGRIGCDKGS